MTEHFTHGYALLVGVNANAVADLALPDVAKDIAALRAVLSHPQRCAYPQEQLKVLTGAAATRTSILDGLDWLGEQAEADSQATVVIYYTGHGLEPTDKDASFYFVPYDVRKRRLRARALRAADFADAVGAIEAERVLVVLDCCHAGGMGVKGEGLAPEGFLLRAAPVTLWPEMAGKTAASGAKGLTELAQGHGRAVLSSSTGKQRSYLRRDRKMSIFTYHLIEALTGHAQPADGAGEVLVSDVMSYVHRHVPQSAQADWGKQQTPDYRVSGNFPIALLLGGDGLSKGQPAPDPLETPGFESAAPHYHADLKGNGAIAQGPGAQAVGAGGVMVGGNVGGSIVTGKQSTVTPSGAQTSLPARCPHCGATLRPNQVTWLSATAAQCSHCGGTVAKT